MAVYGEKWFEDGDFATREDMVAGIKIGSTVLEYDQNRRVYDRDTQRTMHRGHFCRVEVVGETSRSWILRHVHGGRKVPKKSLAGIYSNQCADRAGWFQKHRHEIERAVGRNMDYDFAVELVERLGLDIEVLGS